MRNQRKSVTLTVSRLFLIAAAICVGLTLASFWFAGNPNTWGGIPWMLAHVFLAAGVLTVIAEVLGI